jgi:hypothetical protein
VRRLHLLVGEAGGAAHQAAAEAVPGLGPVRGDAHLDEQAAALLGGAEAAPAVGQRLRQHRHDAVGEVDAVAALASRVVERCAGADVVRDVSDRDDQAEPVSVGLGVDRIVEVARVLAVDGDERRVAQVGAVAERGRAGGGGFAQGGVGELGRDVVRVDAHEADRARVAHRAQPLHDARGLQAETLVRERGGQDDLARLCGHVFARRDDPLGFRAAVGGHDAGGRRSGAEDADDAAGRVGEALDGSALVAAAVDRAQLRHHPLAGRQGGLAAPLGGHEDLRRGPLAVPAERARERVAVLVRAGDLHGHLVRQAAGLAEAAGAGRGERAFGREGLQEVAKLGLAVGRDVERAGDLALADPAGALPDEAAHFFARGQGGRVARGAWGHSPHFYATAAQESRGRIAGLAITRAEMRESHAVLSWQAVARTLCARSPTHYAAARCGWWRA